MTQGLTLEYFMIAWALILNAFVFFWFMKELYKLLVWYCKKNYIYWSKDHSIEHIEYISLYLLFIIVFFGWLLFHWWVEHWIQVHLINEYAFIILYIMWLSNNVLLGHIRKERLETK